MPLLLWLLLAVLRSLSALLWAALGLLSLHLLMVHARHLRVIHRVALVHGLLGLLRLLRRHRRGDEESDGKDNKALHENLQVNRAAHACMAAPAQISAPGLCRKAPDMFCHPRARAAG